MTGRVEQGIVKTGEEVEVLGIQNPIKTTVTGARESPKTLKPLNPSMKTREEVEVLGIQNPIKTTVTGEGEGAPVPDAACRAHLLWDDARMLPGLAVSNLNAQDSVLQM